jgi:UDP-glucose 4-epimerase
MIKVLVTGGAGFIGSHLCDTLDKDKYLVFSLDNYSTGSKDNHVPDVSYITGNTFEIFDVINFVPDIIYHLGEYSRVEQSFDDIEKVIAYNKLGTMSVIEFAKLNSCRLIYAGSSTKFGDNGSNSSPYAWTKTENTEYVKNYGEWFGLDYAITYFYNVYGGREIKEGKYATLIAKFLKTYKDGLPLTVTKPGTQSRNFTHIEDIISGLILVGEMGKGDGYGIGSDEKYNIIEIAEMFGRNFKMTPEKNGNRYSAELITDKIKELGWKAKHSIKDYIKGEINA